MTVLAEPQTLPPILDEPVPDDTGVTTVELAHAAGITYRQADYWVRIGVLEPRVDASGSGTKRQFGQTEVWVAWFVGTCSRAGINPSDAVKAARNGGWLAPGIRVTLTPEVSRHAPGHQIPDGPAQAVPV